MNARSIPAETARIDRTDGRGRRIDVSEMATGTVHEYLSEHDGAYLERKGSQTFVVVTG